MQPIGRFMADNGVLRFGEFREVDFNPNDVHGITYKESFSFRIPLSGLQ